MNTRAFSSISGRLAKLAAAMPSQLPAVFADPITRMLRAKIAAGETSTPTTPQARAEAEALVNAWLARGTVAA